MSTFSPIHIESRLLSDVVDLWYCKMRDDYRINRYFYDRPLPEQAAPLKQLLTALLGGESVSAERVATLADQAFTAAFARGNAKPSMVNNRDFAFLSTLMNGDILGDDDGTPDLALLCPAHSHFLRLNPIDEVFDIALELLQDSLNELRVESDTTVQLLNFASLGKEGVMGRGKPIYENEDRSSRFRTHG
jgi:hypothetical protein